MNKADLIKLAAILLVLVMAVALFSRIDKTQDREETMIVRQAVLNAALTCYAVEGAYPDDREYLREYYQLAYDEDRYYVTYDYVGANLMPDIYVTEADAE